MGANCCTNCNIEPWLVLLDFVEFILSLILRLIFDSFFLFTSPIWYFIEAYQGATIKKKEFKTILITGASSGIGKAVAIEFVKRTQNRAKYLTLFLLGRNKKRLNETKQICLEINPKTKIYFYSVDIRNKKELKKVLIECDDISEIDLLFANAGIGTDQTHSTDWFDRFEEIVNVNIFGTFNTIFPLLKRFIKRKSGHIAFNSSIASYNILLGSTSIYSATKIFIRFMSEIIRCSVMYYRIDCSVINLGFVDTPMSNKNVKNWTKPVDTTAKVIVNGLFRNKSTIQYPFYLSFIMWYIGSLHPVLNNCINWISMPGQAEPDYVFHKYLFNTDGDYDFDDENEQQNQDNLNVPLMSDDIY